MANRPLAGLDPVGAALPSGVGSVLFVDLAALAANLTTLRTHVGDRCIWAVVKADAYGLGAVPVARALRRAGADGLAVARIEEAAELRAAGIDGPILILGPLPDRIPDDRDLVLSAGGRADLQRLAQGPTQVRVHVKIDAGMGRRGLSPAVDEWLADAQALGERWTGVWAHYSHADQGVDHPASVMQQATFAAAVGRLAERGRRLPDIHLANSAGVDRLGPGETAVRVGLWLYGVDPRPVVPAGGLPPPAPVLEWLAPVAEVRTLPTGHGVHYGHAYTTKEPETLGLLGVGYADGLRADHGGRLQAWWRGARRPVRGRVTMDLTALSLPGADEGARGEPVWLLGPRAAPDGIGVKDLAAATGRIPWEVLTAIGRRVPRVYAGLAAGDAGGP